MGAIFTSLDMTAERFGATYLDRRHDATLGEAQMGLVRSAPGVAVAAEHIRHLQTWPSHGRLIRPTARTRCSGAQEDFVFVGSY
jgi:hypothetical protein